MNIHRVARRFIDCMLIGICIGFFFPGITSATENDSSTPTLPPDEIQSIQETVNFEYQLEGRPDPFMPFIQPKVGARLDMDEIVDDTGDVPLTGMQIFEPGQLKLVGILETGGKKIAMVEDDTGKGYVINEGTLIGKKGVVSRITADNDVVITETARTRAGKEIVNTVVMRLNKEGDQ